MSPLQLRLFDGQLVEHFKGALGTFDIEDEEAEHFAADATVVLIVAATIDGATVKRASDGDWIRTNKLVSKSVRVAVGELREELIDIFNLVVADQLTLPVGAPAPPGPPAGVPPAPPAPPAPVAASTSVQPADGVSPDLDDLQDLVDQGFEPVSLDGALPTPIQLPRPGDPALQQFLQEEA